MFQKVACGWSAADFCPFVLKQLPHDYEPKQLVDAIWAGTAAMVKNGGIKSNETAFWEKFAEIFGSKALEDKPLFEEFYEKDFMEVKALCGYNPKAVQAAGLDIFLLTDCLINRERRDINRYPRGRLLVSAK